MARRTYKQRVANGARWLDQTVPGWEDRIDPATLDLANGAACICGQLFDKQAKRARKCDGYEYAQATLFSEANSWVTALVGMEATKRASYWRKRMAKAVGHIYDPERWAKVDQSQERARKVAIALGFLIDDSGLDQFSGLQRAWQQLLKQRKAASDV